MSTRIPLPHADLAAPQLPLPPEAVHYLVEVLRLSDDSPVVAFDGAGREVATTLRSTPAGWALHPTDAPRSGVTGAPLTVVYGLPKGEKLDRVIRQISELGVAEVILVEMARCVVRLKGDRAAKRLDRLARVAKEAARQAGRADVLNIRGPLSLSDAISATEQHAVRAVLHPGATTRFSDLPPVAPLAVWVGPEGGFDPGELQQLAAAGWTGTRLGASILRTETAATVASALALAHLGAL